MVLRIYALQTNITILFCCWFSYFTGSFSLKTNSPIFLPYISLPMMAFDPWSKEVNSIGEDNCEKLQKY